MYRLVKFPSLKGYRSQFITPLLTSQMCFLCGVKHGIVHSNLKNGYLKTNGVCKRNLKTKADVNCINELIKRKRFQKDKKFYTELLEVINNESKQTKAPVRKLKPNDVSRMSITPNLELDNFHKIKVKQRKEIKEVGQTRVLEDPTLSAIVKGVEQEFLKRDVKMHGSHAVATNLSSNKSSENKYFPSKRNVESNLQTKKENKAEMYFHSEKKNNRGINLRDKSRKQTFSLHENLEDMLITSSNCYDFEENMTQGTNSLIGDIETEENVISTGDIENSLLLNDKTKATMENTSEKNGKRIIGWDKRQGTKKQVANEKIMDMERKGREAAFNATLYSYLSLCVSCNFLHRGLATLRHYIYRSQMSTNNQKVKDIKIFEILMHGFAATGNQSKVDELWKMMTTAELEPSVNMFAARLECAGRSPKHPKHIPEIISSMRKMGYEINDIFEKCTFIGDQREVILEAVREVESRFVPVITPPNICYSCSLLQEINNQKGKNDNLQSPSEGVVNASALKSFAEEQFNNELLLHLKVKSVEKRNEPLGLLEHNRSKLETMRQLWLMDLKKALKRDLSIMEKTDKRYSVSLLPFLKVLDVDSYVDVMMKEIERLAEGSETFSPTTFQLYRHLGQQVKNRYTIQFKKRHGIWDKTKMLYDKYCDWYLNPHYNSRSLNGRQEWQQLLHIHQNGPSITGDDDFWPGPVMLGIGKFLYNIIVGDVKIDVNILNKTKEHLLPAFYRVYRQQGVKSVEEIKPHPVISKLFRAAGQEDILFDITQVPMVAPPLPWTSHQTGGYLLAKTDIIRLPDQALQQRQRLQEAPPPQIYPALDSLNQLGSIPWKVNTPVLDTVIEVFNNGGSPKLDIPESPSSFPPAEPVDPSMSNEERYQAYRERMLLRRQKAETYSLWCDALYKLSLANHFRDRIFWLPHNMDFRGRVYPCPPHLNHLGADMSRSLLCFAQGKPLGPGGLDWLKIHLVNLLGTKKRNSIQDRLDYANGILPEILDSAEKPLTGMKWWQESECPWQTLACCLEINRALKHAGGPEAFVSHFPIHQDGSCNGLQHYAALGRDEAGAASVNLLPQDLPQDVYSCVAALVERERAKDSAAGVVVAQQLDGFVRRKVIKQTVMTTVYGVTRFGARLQIAKQLKDIDSFPKEFVWPASAYLVLKTFESLREMFQSTKEIQDWFTECARLVSQVCGRNMEYVTPLGLPVVQHYSRLKRFDNSSARLGHLPDNFPIDTFERPNVMKQKNAFPPNFIHSLDSSHMMLTSIFAEQEGITFVSVHDCYWTHANTVHIMNKICREQFVALHSEPILEDLSKFMLKTYACDESEPDQMKESEQTGKQKLNSVLLQVPPKGTFILENVLDSIYFFS